MIVFDKIDLKSYFKVYLLKHVNTYSIYIFTLIVLNVFCTLLNKTDRKTVDLVCQQGAYLSLQYTDKCFGATWTKCLAQILT